MPSFGKALEIPYSSPTSFIQRKKNLEHLYDSLDPTAISAILGNGQLRKLHEENLSTLKDARGGRIIRLRFGLEDGKPHTLEDIGKEYRVSRDRIGTLLNKSLKILRHPSRSGKIIDYLDHQYQEYQKSL